MKTFLFDLDGTLINSLGDLADSVNLVLKKRGLPTHPEEAYCYFVGDGMRNLIIRALPEDLRTPDMIEEVLQDYASYYSRHTAVRTRPYPGIVETLRELKELGCKTAVVTNKPDPQANIVIKELFEEGMFDIVAGNREGFKTKPDPSLALDVMRRLLVQPEDCVFVGDSGVDMQTAKNCGALPVGVLWGFRTEQELLDNGALHLIDTPTRLIKFVK
ncbi:MAG: HAD family hydrolase [Clostridiales bacterium]|nr:HAD family hydrolase [Clostridiales bacterium]